MYPSEEIKISIKYFSQGTQILQRRWLLDTHLRTLHGGVGSTMIEVRIKYWIPIFWLLSKHLKYMCSGCKRFQLTAFKALASGLLPKDRTEGSRVFQVIGTDNACHQKIELKDLEYFKS